MPSNRIKLTTSGLLIARTRQLDFNHAVQIIDHLNRGYHVTVRGVNDGWKVTFVLIKGTFDADGTAEARVSKNEAITNQRPPWLAELKLYLQQHDPVMFPKEERSHGTQDAHPRSAPR